ncbi:unnamed protein product [Rotaria sp. Silwood1]|nr:unnamed protein product [Rotaria sp. Silwood1]
MNVQQRIGGNSQLSPAGKEYTEVLAKYIANENIKDLIVWTSQMQQAIQTAAKLNVPKEQWKALNGINAGIFEGLTYQEVAESYPEQFAARNRSKYYYRYPGGENSEYNRAVVETLNEFLEVHSEIKVSPAITQTVYQDAGIASETIDVNGNQTPLMDTTIVDITLNNSLSSIQDSTI